MNKSPQLGRNPPRNPPLSFPFPAPRSFAFAFRLFPERENTHTFASSGCRPWTNDHHDGNPGHASASPSTSQCSQCWTGDPPVLQGWVGEHCSSSMLCLYSHWHGPDETRLSLCLATLAWPGAFSFAGAHPRITALFLQFLLFLLTRTRTSLSQLEAPWVVKKRLVRTPGCALTGRSTSVCCSNRAVRRLCLLMWRWVYASASATAVRFVLSLHVITCKCPQPCSTYSMRHGSLEAEDTHGWGASPAFGLQAAGPGKWGTRRHQRKFAPQTLEVSLALQSPWMAVTIARSDAPALCKLEEQSRAHGPFYPLCSS